MLELVVSRGGKDLIVVPLERASFRIGRSQTNDLAVPDTSVSRQQCQIEIRDSQAWLLDRSGKGTIVDGKRCKEAPLAPGAKLEFGSLQVILRERREGESPSFTAAGGVTESMPLSKQSDELWLTGAIGKKPLRMALRGMLSIGSESANDVVIKDSFVSGFHCHIYQKSEAWFITDLDSTNGTLVNNVRVGEARLDPGCELKIGRVRLQIEGSNKTLDPVGLGAMQSVDPNMKPIFELIRRAAPSDETVLITGESGTGKELAARELHRLSRRADKPLLPLNCSALTKELLESELFGHEKGAFTGAQTRRTGLFEEADGGTLFLDEIGELPFEFQAKLLRVLENGEVRSVGSNVTRRVDVRVIAATHRDLKSRIAAGEFREDLFYRICVIEINLPALRERPADIPLLGNIFLSQATREIGKRSLHPQAIKQLSRYRFPGNIRELKNIITRAAILCPGEEIKPDHLSFNPPTLAERISERRIYQQGKTLREVEIEAIRQALAANGCNHSGAAKALGIARSTFMLKIEKYQAELADLLSFGCGSSK
jgi:DNA-binding NtrC family response regulator